MKQTMKLVVVAVLLALTSLDAFAQQIQNLISSSTTTVPAQASNALATAFSTTRGKDVYIQASFALTGAGTSGVLFSFDTSADNSVWQTGTHSFWIPASGTTAVKHATNWTINAVPFMRLNIIHNTNAAIVTNLVVKAVVK